MHHRHPAGATLQLSRVIFRSAADEAPATLAQLLAPRFVVLEPGAALTLFDAGKVTSLPTAQMSREIRQMLAAPDVAQALREWKYVMYTVRAVWGAGAGVAAGVGVGVGVRGGGRGQGD